jgi:hypothetical protein
MRVRCDGVYRSRLVAARGGAEALGGLRRAGALVCGLRDLERTANGARGRADEFAAYFGALYRSNRPSDDCLRASAGETVGRPHIVRALAIYPENAKILEGIRSDMERTAVSNPRVAMDYAHMLERPASDYPYRLFLSEDAFIPGIYVDYLYSVDMDSAVRLIRGAGGVAVVAHWYTTSKRIDAKMLEEMVEGGRLDGVEIMGNPINTAARRAEPMMVALASRTGCIATYGADAHRAEDLASFVADRELARRTVGQTQRLLERAKVNLRFSNFGS